MEHVKYDHSFIDQRYIFRTRVISAVTTRYKSECSNLLNGRVDRIPKFWLFLQHNIHKYKKKKKGYLLETKKLARVNYIDLGLFTFYDIPSQHWLVREYAVYWSRELARTASPFLNTRVAFKSVWTTSNIGRLYRKTVVYATMVDNGTHFIGHSLGNWKHGNALTTDNWRRWPTTTLNWIRTTAHRSVPTGR